MKKLCGMVALLLCLSLLLPAQAELKEGSNASRLLAEEEGVEFFLSKVKEWTLVTPENMEDHMGLLTALGDSEDAVRYRFANGNIVFEAYHKGMPDGRVRLQVFEDEFTRSIWHLDDLTKKQYIAVADELEGSLFQGYLQIVNVKYNASNTKGRMIEGAMIAYPPFAYESGRFSLYFINGKAYLVSYTQPTEATQQKHMKGNTYPRMEDWTPVGKSIKLTGEKKTAVADLRTDYSRLILNVHSGEFSFTGISEKDARVVLKNGGREWEAAVNQEGTYSADIILHEGENEILAVATKDKLEENTLSRVISVDDGMAALELHEYPYEWADRENVRVSGKAAPGAQVWIKLDEKEPVSADVKADGVFSYQITDAEDFQEHTLEITAREEGKEDCTAKFSFTTEYADASKGIKAYGKVLTEGVSAKSISQDPAAHVGSRVKLEVYTKEAERTDGRLILKGHINKNEDMPIILVCDSYMEDMILPKMILTVYGEVIEPSLTETPVPRIQVEYIQYLKLVYRR